MHGNATDQRICVNRSVYIFYRADQGTICRKNLHFRAKLATKYHIKCGTTHASVNHRIFHTSTHMNGHEPFNYDESRETVS